MTYFIENNSWSFTFHELKAPSTENVHLLPLSDGTVPGKLNLFGELLGLLATMSPHHPSIHTQFPYMDRHNSHSKRTSKNRTETVTGHGKPIKCQQRSGLFHSRLGVLPVASVRQRIHGHYHQYVVHVTGKSNNDCAMALWWLGGQKACWRNEFQLLHDMILMGCIIEY